MDAARVNWQLKAIVPVVAVLLGGLLLFVVATLSLGDSERHRVLIVAGVGAVVICGDVDHVHSYTSPRRKCSCDAGPQARCR